MYNIASGRAVTVREVVDLLLQQTDRRVRVEVDPERLRPSDVPILLGDYSKFHERTGWEPHIPLEDTLSDLLRYWREKMCSVLLMRAPAVVL